MMVRQNLEWFFKRLAYRLMRLRPLNVARRSKTSNPIVLSLLRDGIAVVPWQAVFGERADQSALFQQMKSDAEEFRGVRNTSTDWKASYLKRRFRPGDVIPAGSPLLLFTTHPRLHSVLKEFFAGSFRALAADYWHTVPADGPATASQKWHTDPEDTIMCKVFVYFTDVDEAAGATEFLVRSQVGGDEQCRVFEVKGTSGRYYSDDEVSHIFANGAKSIKACGETGTLVFINTTGLHRGGKGTKERIMGNFTFVSPWCPLKRRWAVG